jgi:hypothetical protein
LFTAHRRLQRGRAEIAEPTVLIDSAGFISLAAKLTYPRLRVAHDRVVEASLAFADLHGHDTHTVTLAGVSDLAPRRTPAGPAVIARCTVAVVHTLGVDPGTIVADGMVQNSTVAGEADLALEVLDALDARTPRTLTDGRLGLQITA